MSFCYWHIVTTFPPPSVFKRWFTVINVLSIFDNMVKASPEWLLVAETCWQCADDKTEIEFSYFKVLTEIEFSCFKIFVF